MKLEGSTVLVTGEDCGLEEFALLVRHVVENVMLNGGVIRLDGDFRVAAE